MSVRSKPNREREADVTLLVPNIRPDIEPDREFNYVDISSICNETFRITDTKTVKGADAPSRARRPVQPNDTLFSNVRTYLRNIALVDDATKADVCSTGFIFLRPDTTVDPRYLFRYTLSDAFIDVVSPQQTGTHYPATSDRAVLTQRIPLPPLAEQRRIVGKLELLLGKVSSSQQRLSRVPGLLKRFRQSVLAACSGKLTADWREENEAAPIDSPTEIDIPADFPTLPESWSWTTLESVCVNVVDCPHSTPKWTDAGKLCIRTTNFLPGMLALSEVRYVSSETFNERIERLRPAPGDIVNSREGGILGIACQIPPGVELCLGQRMMLFRVGSECTATMLMHWLNSPVITHRVQELTGGSASPHLNVRDIRTFPTPAPPLSEQQEIVCRVEKLFAFADQIEARLEQAQSHVDRLTQSLLAKAFRGELVSTEALAIKSRRSKPHIDLPSLAIGSESAQASCPSLIVAGTAPRAVRFMLIIPTKTANQYFSSSQIQTS